MRINHWYKIGHDKMMQAAFWGWWEGLSFIRRTCGMYCWKVNNEGLFVKVPEKTMLMFRDLCQELTEM